MKRTRTPKKEFDTLKAWRDFHGWTTQRAADFLGISSSAYSRLELGQRFVKGQLAADIRDKAKVPLEVVVGAN